VVAYTYSRVSALNFNTTPPTVAKSATGSVYAIADTTFTTPLNVTLVVGGSVSTTLSSDANGFFPDFTILDRTSVVWKQASSSFTTVLTTTDPVPGPQGAAGTAGSQGPKGDPGDVPTWKATTFYPLNMAVVNPSGDLVKVTTAHTSTASYDATKFTGTYAKYTQLAKNPDTLIAGAITLDGSDQLLSAVVQWPDGTPGTLTVTARHSTGAVNAYNITYGSPATKTFTQPAVTRNASGAATNVPQIVVS